MEGRADGIIEEEGHTVIDEIKGVYMELVYLEEPISVHKAQAMCYAYMYGKPLEKESIEVQMTYCQIETEEIKRFRETFRLSYLEKWFEDLMAEYYKWAEFQYRRRRERQISMEGLEFPYPYREGQRALVTGVYHTIHKGRQLFIQAPTGIGKTMAAIFPAVRAVGEGYREGQRALVTGVYHTIHKGRQLFIQAPTGIGKTMAAIFPAVRAVGEGYGDKIFYLTAKTITRTMAEEAFAILKSKGLSYKTLSITAKEKLCLCEETECNPEKCPYAKGHFDRVNDAVFELLNSRDTLLREELLEQAEHYQVCPYEMCLDVSNWVDAIICDYNYVFDPKVHLKRFFGDGVKGDYIFLIDEAHNLVERGRKMYSATLCKEDFLELARMVKEVSGKLHRLLKKCNQHLLEYKRECDDYEVLENIAGFSLQLMNLLGEMEHFLEQEHDEKVQKAVLEFSFEVRHFLNMYDLTDENYVIYTHYGEQGDFLITLFCVNPKRNLQDCLNKGKSTVFFSGTFLPLPYYRSLFSMREDDYAIYANSPFPREHLKDCLNKGKSTVFFSGTFLPLPYYRSLFSMREDDYAIYANSPFPREHLKLLVARDVSSKYTRRDVAEYEKMAEYILQMLLGKKGNYLVFFPSYRMMEDISQILEEKLEKNNSKVRCLYQTPSMSEQEREEFLEKFQEEGEETLAGFCVVGGIFSEGIDLAGKKLIGAAIVGTGLPQVGSEREILKEYYDKKGNMGFAYAYRYPGMNKVLQAAGRVIRTKTDKGVVLLLDERFLQHSYQELFPPEWQGYEVCTVSQVGEKIKRFWNP